MDDQPRTKLYRFYEMIPGLTTWTILATPVLLSIFAPKAAYLFILFYVMIWFFRAIKSSIFLVHSYYKYKGYAGADWHFLLRFFSDSPPTLDDLSPYFDKSTKLKSPLMKKLVNQTFYKVELLKTLGKFKQTKSLYHVVLMATYKEDLEILDSSIKALSQVDYPLDKIIFVLATEERDKERAETNSKILKEKYGEMFGEFRVIMHPKDLPNEVPAKGANISFAAAQLADQFIEKGIDLEDVLLTTLDADNRPHKDYFTILTWHYLMESDRTTVGFQPLAFFHNNIWEVPFINRLVALSNTFWYLSESGERERLFTAAAYAMNMKNLVEVGFWSKESIVEDLFQYWRNFFHFKGKFRLEPLFIPIYQDALENKTYFRSLIGQYKQLRRWAWGCNVVAYNISKLLSLKRQKVKFPYFRAWAKNIELFYHQVMWSSGPILLFFNQLIPRLINPDFAKSLFAYNVGVSMQFIFNGMLVGIVAYMFITLLSLPKPPGRYSSLQKIGVLFSWLLLPLITLVYGALPPLEAQTRLMLGGTLGFGVTEKVRKK